MNRDLYSRRGQNVCRLGGIILLGLAIYVVAYFFTTELYRGAFGGSRIDHRLFKSATHRALFKPLATLEESLRSRSGIEFHAEVGTQGGAWLPPPVDE